MSTHCRCVWVVRELGGLVVAVGLLCALSCASQTQPAPAEQAATSPAAQPETPANVSVSKQAPSVQRPHRVEGTEKPGWKLMENRDEGLMQLGIEAPTHGLSELDLHVEALLNKNKPPEAVPMVEVGQALFVQVQSRECLSFSCDRNPVSSCSVERKGRELRVSSVLRREQPDGADVPCTEDCGRQSATCKTPALEAGEYVVAFDRQKLTLRVPGKLNQTILESTSKD